MEFSVCIEAVYGSVPWEEALKRMNAIGYKNFEFWAWWNKDILKLIETKEELDMNLVTFCTRMISLTNRDQRSAYKEGLEDFIFEKIEKNRL